MGAPRCVPRLGYSRYAGCQPPTIGMTFMRMPKTVPGHETTGHETTGQETGPQPAGPGPTTAAAAGAGTAGSGAAGSRLRTAAQHGRRLVPAARRHWLVSILLLAGLVLRVLAQLAYRPALLYIDSVKYLYNGWPGTDPVGYKVPLKAILLVRQPGDCRRCTASPRARDGRDHLRHAAAPGRRRAGWLPSPSHRCCWTPTSCRSSRPSCPTSGSRRSSSPGSGCCCGGHGPACGSPSRLASRSALRPRSGRSARFSSSRR